MNKVITRYGLLSALILIALGLFNLVVLGKLSYEAQEIAGYLTIFVSLVFVFVGIRQFRDQYNGGNLTFGEGLKVGVLIVLIPSIAFGLLDIVYTRIINPEWQTEYYNHYLEQLKTLPAAEYEQKRKDLEAQRAMFSSPFVEFLLMSLTVFVLGLIVTVISSLALRKKV
jgi:hypothetical protein